MPGGAKREASQISPCNNRGLQKVIWLLFQTYSDSILAYSGLFLVAIQAPSVDTCRQAEHKGGFLKESLPKTRNYDITAISSSNYKFPQAWGVGVIQP